MTDAADCPKLTPRRKPRQWLPGFLLFVAVVVLVDALVGDQSVARSRRVQDDLVAMGAELSVLKGGLTTLRKHRPIILMELSDRTLEGQGSLSSEILSFLHASAYKVFEYTKSGLQEALPDRTYDGNNVIAIPLESVGQTTAILS